MASGSTCAPQGHTAQTPLCSLLGVQTDSTDSQSFHRVSKFYSLHKLSSWPCHLVESAKQIICFSQNTAHSAEPKNSCGGEEGGPPDTLGLWGQAKVVLTFQQWPQQEV